MSLGVVGLMVLIVPLAVARSGEPSSAQTLSALDAEFFEKQIRPILANRCFECHGPTARDVEGGLWMTGRASLLKGGDSGPAIVPGAPSESLLIDAVKYGESFQMPPRGKLPATEIAKLTEWVRRGAPWPMDGRRGVAVAPFDLAGRKASHWCWQPVKQSPVPDVGDNGWPINDIDRFILAKLEEQGLAPQRPADRRTLIRRLSFDLTGLPPTPEEIETFVSDQSPAALATVVDRLLASPRFGERWARHWMDLVRYAETHGHEFDFPIPHAHRYRDYLIRALNADVPYDQLVREHIAGDLLPNPRLHPIERFNESIIATGFWCFGEAVQAPTDVLRDHADRVDNQIDVMTKAFLGLTVGCARCHDHKFDAIGTDDYYALAGYLYSSRRQIAALDPHGRTAEIARTIRTAKSSADELLRDALAAEKNDTARRLGGCLAAARDAFAAGEGQRVKQDAALREIAARHRVDAALLRRWLDVLDSAESQDPSSPMYPLATALARIPKPGDLGLENLRAQWREAVSARRSELAAYERDSRPFEDFDDGSFRGWFVTGEAFGEHPTSPGEWNSQAHAARLAEPGVAHSGLASTRLRGTLRSPTFTITHPRVHYRLASTGARIRVTIDGFFPNEFNALLFGQTITAVDTRGDVTWQQQAGDIGKYLGHQAYIEIEDNGDGYIAVDEIRFASSDPPKHSPPHPIVEEFAEAESVNGMDALLTFYARSIDEALRRWRKGELTAADSRLLDWMLQRALLDCSPSTGERLFEAASRIDKLASALPAPFDALAIADGTGEDVKVNVRGDPHKPGHVAKRSFLTAIAGGNQVPCPANGSGRLLLANQMVSPENPLVARVIVNRVWQHLLGRGIVPTVDNFGALGEPPTHPELLDYLASDFRAEGWSIKKLVRSIVLSRTYQMASERGPADAIDPDNRWWHRADIRRLEGEAIRDAMLAVSGRLDPTPFGPPVPIHLTEHMQGRGRPGASGPLDGAGRRTIYLDVRRNFLSPLLLVFDAPPLLSCVGQRMSSNVPAQALALLNDPLVHDQASVWAKKVLAKPREDVRQRIAGMYLAAFGRNPTDEESAATVMFLDRQSRLHASVENEVERRLLAWTDLCHAMFNAKDFIYVQ